MSVISAIHVQRLPVIIRHCPWINCRETQGSGHNTINTSPVSVFTTYSTYSAIHPHVVENLHVITRQYCSKRKVDWLLSIIDILKHERVSGSITQQN